MVSLKTIAKECGVSTATVSKALNNQKDVSIETKLRIKKVAEAMGYMPNAAAKALKTNRSYNIGVLFEDEAGSGLTHEYFSAVLNGFKKQAEKLGYDITFINTSSGRQKMTYLEHSRYRNFVGVVIICANYIDPEVIELMDSDISTVTVDFVHHNCMAVSSNNVSGMEDLVKYIYKQGHRRIAYIHGQSNSSVTRERIAGFYRTAEELGLKIPNEYVREAKYLEIEDTEIQTRELLSIKNKPTCIIYPDDNSLLGGLSAIAKMGLKIPKDISVAGYDGTRVSQLMYPKITTIKQDADKIGEEAAVRLIRSIEHPKTTLLERVVIDGKLILGQSVGEHKVY